MKPITNWTLSLLVLLCSCFVYFYIGYCFSRVNFGILLVCWSFLFVGSYYLSKHSIFSIKQLAFVAIGFRFIFLFVTPNLSQDFYRFIWDGRMLFEGFNPYLTTPKNLMEQNNILLNNAEQLFNGMGLLNASHYTNYPPFSQLCYLIAAVFGSKSIVTSIVVMRLQIILADIGILFFGIKILKQLKLPVKNILLYILNPFIIIELTGNLHFEAVMAFFLVLSLYLLFNKKWIGAAITLALSISVKLIPLLFLPLFFLYFLDRKLNPKNWKPKNSLGFIKYVVFCLIIFVVTFLLFYPFLSKEFMSNFTKTISLWFLNFEFNASIYYIIRWIGFKVTGWNIIASAGKILPLISILIIALLSLFRKNFNKIILIESMLFSISAYLFLSTTIHPWYLTIPLILSIFTKYGYLWIWTFAIILSYSAYANPNFRENIYLVILEYLIVFGFLFYEIIIKSKKSGLIDMNKV